MRFLKSLAAVALILSATNAYAQQPRPGSNVRAVVRKLVGLFVESTIAADLQGVVVPAAGAYDAAAPSIADEATFLRTVALVR